MTRRKFHLVIKYDSHGRRGVWNPENSCWKMKPTADVLAVRKRMESLYNKWKGNQP